MFVTAARIAAHLYFATKIAKNLSLTAKMPEQLPQEQDNKQRVLLL